MLRNMAVIPLFVASAVTAFSNQEPANSNRARELVLDACTACHTLDRVKIQRLTSDEWRQTIAGMLSEGVPLTDDETTLVVDYLAQNFGPENP
jgi:Quinohemoprotein amine dehydrogenase A, alpha subunit, haem binding